MAPLTLPASEQEINTAVAPSFTACAMRCACTWPSSDGGVSHTISTGTPCFCDMSFAAASAPVRAERNTGFVELFAIIAILIDPPDVAGVLVAGAPVSLLHDASDIDRARKASVATLFAGLCMESSSLSEFITARLARAAGALPFSMLAGPHPRSRSLGGCAPRSGRRRFTFYLFPYLAARASLRAVKLALVRSNTTAMIVAHPMMIHS
jgi:hypothetical protein